MMEIWVLLYPILTLLTSSSRTFQRNTLSYTMVSDRIVEIPFQFIEKAINRYRELRINPLTKTIIFSDALTMEKAAEINRNCKGRIGCAFGIGTHLTNDFGLKPANIVMKLIQCQMNENQPLRNCIKLSDANGKHMGNPDEVALAEMLISRR